MDNKANETINSVPVTPSQAGKPLDVQAKDEAKAPKVDPVAQQVEEALVEEDRSAFNCSACNGEGLQDEQHICPVCNGTGKV